MAIALNATRGREILFIYLFLLGEDLDVTRPGFFISCQLSQGSKLVWSGDVFHHHHHHHHQKHSRFSQLENLWQIVFWNHNRLIEFGHGNNIDATYYDDLLHDEV